MRGRTALLQANAARGAVEVGCSLAALRRMASKSVHCVVTSPPYWGKRDYENAAQFGQEPTLAAYVARLVELFAEVRRVLRDDGTLWLNLGDGFATRARARTGSQRTAKDLIGLPWRVAFALQESGWCLRTDIVWEKPNPMPESVGDRPTRAHEFVFVFSKARYYFYDRTALLEPLVKGAGGSRFDAGKTAVVSGAKVGRGDRTDPAGRNARDVWQIAPDPFAGAHFAAMPSRLAERCILAGTSAGGACSTCGKPLRRIVQKQAMVMRRSAKGDALRRANGTACSGRMVSPPTSETIGWALACKCPATAAPVPCLVLDPFGGVGTVGHVAEFHGRSSTLLELNPDYIALMPSRRESVLRILEKPRARRAGTPRPPQPTPTAPSAQLSLIFGDP